MTVKPRVVLILAWFACAAGAAVAWVHPRPMPDYFMALAGGRDVMQGLLGKPDTWSFVTEGRVWLHQNWGSDTLIYLIQDNLGDPGVLLLKAILVAGTVVFAGLAARERGASWASAMMVCGWALAAWPTGTTIRANLFTLLFLPLMLWILFRSQRRPRFVWATLPVMMLWSNMHGAFVFGLLVMALWSGAHLAEELIKHRRLPPVSKLQGAMAFTAGLVCAGLATPFGVKNLTGALSFSPDSAWRSVVEWMPLFGSSVPAEDPWLFLGFAAFCGVGAVAMLRRGHDAWSLRLIDAVLYAVFIAMAFSSRRFVLFAAVGMAPLAAVYMHSLVSRPRGWVLGGLASLLVLAHVAVNENNLWSYYTTDNEPLQYQDSFFEKMVVQSVALAPGAAAFLRDNQVGGAAFNEYQWESYLRWVAPATKVVVGGRAHQIYTEDQFRSWEQVVAAGAEGHAQEVHAGLGAIGANTVVVPLDGVYTGLIQQLLLTPGSSWVCVYADWRSVVLVDGRTDFGARLCRRLETGDLNYPDSGIRALSRGLYLASPATEHNPKQAYRDLRTAVSMRPLPYVYAQMVNLGLAGGIPAAELHHQLNQERDRLAAWLREGQGGPSGYRSLSTVQSLLESKSHPVSR